MDGLPFLTADDIIEKTLICLTCAQKEAPEPILCLSIVKNELIPQMHSLKMVNVGSVKEFDWVTIHIGLCHVKMNMIKTFLGSYALHKDPKSEADLVCQSVSMFEDEMTRDRSPRAYK